MPNNLSGPFELQTRRLKNKKSRAITRENEEDEKEFNSVRRWGQSCFSN